MVNASILAEKAGSTPNRDEWRRGWPVLVSATVGFGAGLSMIIMSASLFILPMRKDLGWSASEVAITPIIQIVSSLCGPLAGYFVDRRGPRASALTGLAIVGIGMVLMALVPEDKAYLYTLAFAIGLFAPLTNMVPFAKGVALWFPTNMGSALGVTLSGSSLLAVGVLPIVSFLIQSYGWRAGYLSLAAVMFIAIPLIWIAFREPVEGQRAFSTSGAASSTGVTTAQAIRDARFWVLLVALTFAAFLIGGFLVHLQPILAEKKLDIVTATSFGMVFALSIAIGKIGGGILLDRLWDYGVAAGLLIASAIGVFTLATMSDQGFSLALLLGVALLGLAQGAEIDFVAYFTLRLFGRRSYSTILGILAMCTGLSAAAGGLAFSKIVDLTGSYQITYIFGMVGYPFAAALILGIGLRELSRRAPSRPAEVRN